MTKVGDMIGATFTQKTVDAAEYLNIALAKRFPMLNKDDAFFVGGPFHGEWRRVFDFNHPMQEACGSGWYYPKAYIFSEGKEVRGTVIFFVWEGVGGLTKEEREKIGSLYVDVCAEKFGSHAAA